MTQITEKQIKKFLKKQFGFWTKVEPPDNYKWLYPRDEIEKAVLRIPEMRPYVEDKKGKHDYDCDDRATWILAHLASILPGVAGFYIRARGGRGRHRWVMVIDDIWGIHHINAIGTKATLYSGETGGGVLIAYPKIEKIWS